jgi:hypothetical protein
MACRQPAGAENRSSSSNGEAVSPCRRAAWAGPFHDRATRSVPRSTASGVRSSWEASETKSRWRLNTRSSRSSMWSNASDRTPTSSRPPLAPVRTDRSPASTAAATPAMRRSGAAITPASPIPTAIATRSASAPTMTNASRKLDCACCTGVSSRERSLILDHEDPHADSPVVWLHLKLIGKALLTRPLPGS